MLQAYRQDLIAAGAPHVYVAWLAGSESIAWLFVGEWRECVDVLRFVAGRDPGPYSDAALRLTAARLAVLQRLTDREREVLTHIVAGDTYAETASALFISEKTVSAHVSHLLAKTGTSNRVELAQLAAEPPA